MINKTLLAATPLGAAGGAAGSDIGTVDIAAQVKGFFGFECITHFIFRMVDIALIGSAILLLGYLVWGGLDWIMSGGDKSKVENAQKRLTSAVIGVAIAASAFAVWKVVLYFFGIDIANVCTATPFQ